MLATYALMVGAWMFDFRSSGASQGLAIQGIFMLSFLLSFGLFLLFSPRNGARVKGLPIFIGAVFLFIFIAVLSGLMRGQEPYALFRNAFSVFVYATVAYATAKAMVVCHLPSLRRVLGWLALGFSVSSILIIAIFQGGVNLERSRYEILGASTIAGLTILLLTPIYPLKRIEILIALSTTAMTLLSVTRTYIVALAAQIFVLAPAAKRAFRFRTILVLAAGIVALSTLLMSGADVVQRWHDRLFARQHFGGMDPTLISRQSEWKFMLTSAVLTPDKLFVGSGLAAETKYYLDKELGGGGEAGSTGFGHSQHLSIFFIAGLIGGAPLLFLEFIQGWWAFQTIRRLLRISEVQPDLAFLGTWGALMIIGHLASGFFMAHIADRGTALWYGVGTGLLLGAMTLMRRQLIK